jgi:hypothetical protein
MTMFGREDGADETDGDADDCGAFNSVDRQAANDRIASRITSGRAA